MSELDGLPWEDISKLEECLSKLIRNEGLSPRRIELDGSDLLKLVQSNDAEKTYEWIVTALREMEGDQYNDALMNAFGLGESKKPRLSDRRADWIAKLDDPISEDTIRRWEKRAMTALARKLAGTSALEMLDLVDAPRPSYDLADVMNGINDLKRQLATQNDLLAKIIERLPGS